MNTQADTLQESPVRAGVAGATPLSPFRLFGWSVRRELWDNQSLYLAPASVAVLFLLGFFLGPFGVKDMTYISSPQEGHHGFSAGLPYQLAAALLMATTVLVSVFYAIDALYAERRDRSILFWKSLPVSDLIAVLAKASIPLIVLPLIAFGFTVVIHVVMALASSVVLYRLGDPVTPLWSALALPHMWVQLLGHYVTVAALWYAPFYAWLLLVSAWANRAPLLLAFLPPFALVALEGVVFHTSHIGAALKERLAHGNIGPSTPMAANNGLDTPELWLGLLAAACFIAAAVQFRRYRGTL